MFIRHSPVKIFSIEGHNHPEKKKKREKKSYLFHFSPENILCLLILSFHPGKLKLALAILKQSDKPHFSAFNNQVNDG